ncbi:hypothetical protein F5883DRAFT_719553 [Diaporthe sp. PMI_573]|nr:hypothetical protein F5883DRAFT_719553 [Diaporthaceae sp. PMI_573]
MPPKSIFKNSKEAEKTARYLTNYVSKNTEIVTKIGKNTIKSIESISKGTTRGKKEIEYPKEWADDKKTAIAAATKLKQYYSLELKQQETPPPEAQKEDETIESDVEEDQSGEESAPEEPEATSNKQTHKGGSQPVIAISVNPELGATDQDEAWESANDNESPTTPKTSNQPHIPPGPAAEVLYPYDPITREDGEVKGEIYCTTHGTIALHLPPLQGDRRRLIFQPVGTDELKEKKRKYKQHLKDTGSRDIGGIKATRKKDLEELKFKERDAKLIDVGYEVPIDGIPESEICKGSDPNKAQTFWDHGKDSCPILRCVLRAPSNEENEEDIRIVCKSELIKYYKKEEEEYREKIIDLLTEAGMPIPRKASGELL